MWGLSDLFASLVKPVTSLISEGIEDKDKSKAIELRVKELLDGAAARAEAYHLQALKSKTDIILAEAQGGSWLQRNWRPMMMLWFAGLLGLWWFGIQPEGMTQLDKDHVFDLLRLGIGGYIVGRSAEKIAPHVVEAVRK